MPLSYYLALLFIGLPILELAILLKVHRLLHFWPTLLLVVGTGVLGVTLVRRQGAAVLRRAQREIAFGRVPAREILDGVMILLAGALLITPGLITDTAGFLLLVPPVRAVLRRRLRRLAEKKIREGSVEIHYSRIDSSFP